jgi:hypothetical protein
LTEVNLCGHATRATAGVLLYKVGNTNDRCVMSCGCDSTPAPTVVAPRAVFSHVVCRDRCVVVALLDNATRSLLFDTPLSDVMWL